MNEKAPTGTFHQSAADRLPSGGQLLVQAMLRQLVDERAVHHRQRSRY